MSDNTPETVRLRELYERERAISEKLRTFLDAKTQELDLMRQVSDANADEVLKARAERDALRGHLDAKDTEIEFWREAAETQKDNNLAILRKLDEYKDAADENHRLKVEIAERDATIARQAAASARMTETLKWYAEELPHKGSIATKALYDRGKRARQCLQSLKEPNT